MVSESYQIKTGPYNTVVSGRITAKDKQLMDKLNFSVRDAIKYYLMTIDNNHEKLEIKREFLLEDIEKKKIELQIAQMELEQINKKIKKSEKGEQK